jgi:hypothetical protein
MNHAPALTAARAPLHHGHAIRRRALAHTTIEWEELPSLTDTLRRAAPAPRSAPVWNPTLPLGLWQPQPEVAPTPFTEPLRGLHVREISGDEVFHHFFGN